MSKPKNVVIVRTAALAVTWINLGLVQVGWEPLPWSDETVGETLSALVAFGTSVWSWWGNNSFTEEAKLADEHLDHLKARN